MNRDPAGTEIQGYSRKNGKFLSDSEYETLRQQWLATIPVDVEKDMEGTVWTDFGLKSVIVDMETGGIL